MRDRVRKIWIVLILPLLLISCGQPALAPSPVAAPVEAETEIEEEVSSAGAETEAAEEISFMIFGDTAEKAAYEQLVAAFEQPQSDVKVTLIHIPGQSDYRKRLGIDFAAGTPADIVLLNYRRYASFAAKGALEPLGPYLEKSSLIKVEDFYAESLAPFYWEGTLMCIPQNLSSLVVYYNKNLFDQAGLVYPESDWNWADFLATAQALTQDTDGDGDIDQYGLGTEVSIFRLAPFIWQNGGEVVDNPAAPTRLALDTPEAREAVEWFVDLQMKHHVVPDAIQEEAEASESRFQNGRLGMFLNSRRGVPIYREITSFDWDVAHLPQGKERAGILHADAYCMPSTNPHKEATWRFIEFANGPEGQSIIAQSGRTVPSLKSIAESPVFLDPEAKPAHSQVFLEDIPFIRAVPVMDTWVDIEDLLGEELQRAFYGRASVDEVIDTATERTREFFEE